MATAADFSGLFGGTLTPEEQQRQLTEARAAQFASMAPSQQLAFMGYKAGAGLGEGLAQAAGVDIQDPTIKRAATLRQLAQGVDVTSVEGLTQYAQKLQQAGFTAEANKLGQQILSMRESLSKQFQQSSAGTASLASAAKHDWERGDQSRTMELLKTGKYTPESVSAFIQGKGNLEAVDKLTKPTAEFISAAMELGFGDKSQYGMYSQEQVAKINKLVFDRNIQAKKAGAIAIKIPLGEAMTTAFNIADRKEAGQEWAKLGPIYVEGNNTLADLSKFKETAQTGFTGTGAGAKLALSKALGSLGVNIGTKASDTEISDAISSQLVQRIAKVFPGSQSNKELDQLLKSKPNIQQELPTILRLISKMETEIKAQQLTYEQGSKLSPEERATKFNPNIATARNYNMLNRYNTLSEKYRNNNITDAERAEAKKIKEELGL